MILKEEIEKRLGRREKNRINVGLRTPCAGFTPPLHHGLYTPYTMSFTSNTQEYLQENLTGKFLIIHCPSFSLS